MAHINTLPATPPSAEADELADARKLMDAGKLEEAARLCEARLKKRCDCAEAYYLLGIVREAAGDARATECFRRALYLEPNHYESLLQLATLCLKNGEVARAQNFRNRAQRVKSRH